MADDKTHALDIARVEHEGRIKVLEKLVEGFVTHEQFGGVKVLVYGLAGMILTGFATAIIQVVYK